MKNVITIWLSVFIVLLIHTGCNNPFTGKRIDNNDSIDTIKTIGEQKLEIENSCGNFAFKENGDKYGIFYCQSNYQGDYDMYRQHLDTTARKHYNKYLALLREGTSTGVVYDTVVIRNDYTTSKWSDLGTQYLYFNCDFIITAICYNGLVIDTINVFLADRESTTILIDKNKIEAANTIMKKTEFNPSCGGRTSPHNLLSDIYFEATRLTQLLIFEYQESIDVLHVVKNDTTADIFCFVVFKGGNLTMDRVAYRITLGAMPKTVMSNLTATEDSLRIYYKNLDIVDYY